MHANRENRSECSRSNSLLVWHNVEDEAGNGLSTSLDKPVA